MAMTEEEIAKINSPEWTEYRKKNGLDPLGMQNSSVSLYQTFLPGISNVTLRVRYYGLYAWLSRMYAKNVGDTNPQSWKRFIRRAEALYALIAQRKGSETGVAGTEWAQRILNAAQSETINFAQDAEPGSETYYLKQAWGAFGAAYRSQLYTMGIFSSVTEHEIPIPSAEIGDKLAGLFDEQLGDLSLAFYETIQKGSVTLSGLDNFSNMMPSEIGQTSTERDFYQDILFAHAGLEEDVDRSRRLSLLLILKVANLLKRAPKPDEVRWVLYAGCDMDGSPLILDTDELETQRMRWWVYQVNDLCHFALETLLKFTLDVLGTFPGGITLSRLITLCTEKMREIVEVHPKSWNTFLEQLTLAENPYAQNDLQSEWALIREIMPAARNESVCPPESAWKALTLLCILHKRVKESGKDISEELGVFDANAFRSVLTETRFLNQHGDEMFTRTVGRLYEERVIRRHLWIALRKFRYQGDYTFLIEADDGRVKLREKDGPGFTNPRLGPAITFLKDIHLINGNGLTERGVEVAQSL